MIFVTGFMTASSMIIDYIEQSDVKVSQAVTPFLEDNIYWAFVDDNQRLLNLFGFQHDIEIEPCMLGNPIRLGYITEQAFDIMKKALLSTSVICFIDESQEEILYYRFQVKIDEISPMCITVTVNFLDENNSPVVIHDLRIKSARLPTKTGKPRVCKITENTHNTYNIQFEETGDYNIKISGIFRNSAVKSYISWSI